MAFFVKGIKPRRFRSRVFRDMVVLAQLEFAKGVKRDFEKTVETWKKKPRFLVIKETGRGQVSVLVGTDNEIYKFVDEGTEPHPIFAGIFTGKSNKRALAFSSESSPKTTPNVIGSNPGLVGPVDVFVPFVQHPGTKARNFTKTIEEKWRKRYKRMIEGAFSKANKEAWVGQ